MKSLLPYYASPTSGEAYRDRRLTTNCELWVEIFCVPTCFHMRIPKPCLKLTQHWRWNWLNIESQIDSTSKPGRILVPLVIKLFRSNCLNVFSLCVVLAYTRFSWSINFIILDRSFFNKLSATKGKLKNSCLPYESLIRNGYIYTVRIAFLSHMLVSPFIVLVTQRATGSLVYNIKLYEIIIILIMDGWPYLSLINLFDWGQLTHLSCRLVDSPVL